MDQGLGPQPSCEECPDDNNPSSTECAKKYGDVGGWSCLAYRCSPNTANVADGYVEGEGGLANSDPCYDPTKCVSGYCAGAGTRGRCYCFVGGTTQGDTCYRSF